MGNIVNSFTETVNDLIKQSNISLEFAVKTNQSLTTQEDSVNMSIEQEDPVTGAFSTVTYSLPSYNSLKNKVDAAMQTMETFVKGDGKVLLNDGTYREVKTIPVPISPPKITNVSAPVNFKPRNNWFFESLMFPQMIISFNLKGKIDDRSDRISVRRVIFDNSSDDETQWFKDNIVGQELSYYDTIVKLNNNGKKYWQDDEIQDLPLSTEPYTGYFLIIDKQTIDGNSWYYLDTLKYGIPSDGPVLKNKELAKGNFIRYNNSIYKIDQVEKTERRVKLITTVGTDHPTVGFEFEIYSVPFSTKIADIPIGYNECNIVFLKGVTDDYNLLAVDWSMGIPFYTNDLTLNGNASVSLVDYYNQYVSDFGKKLEGEAKEKFIPSWFGEIPDPPVLKPEALLVDRINEQLNSSYDVEEVKNTQTQIESTKTIVNSLRSTISRQKAELVNITDLAKRENLNSKISINVSDLAKRTVEYQSLVRSLSTMAYESDAVTAEPKYRVRGFFDIPEGKKRIPTSKTERPQEVIGFELAYRYLRMDNTGNALRTYDLPSILTGRIKKGVFSDWIILATPIKERIYDSSLGQYIWKQSNIADGDEVNINQVDIPIRKGEKVEIKVRSISEAGWPTNPKKSDWSDPIIKEFPANLSGSDQVTNILTDAIAEENSIKLDETLSASGVIVHLDDAIPNPVSGSGTYFKHQSRNLSFDLSSKDKTGTLVSTSTTDLQTQLNNLSENTFVTLTRPTDATNTSTPFVTGTLQKLFQAMVEKDPSIYEEFENQVDGV